MEWGLALSIDQFYDTAGMIVSNMASFLSIPQERIFIANVVPGTSRRRRSSLRRSLAEGGGRPGRRMLAAGDANTMTMQVRWVVPRWRGPAGLHTLFPLCLWLCPK